ncbi:unnamed protein product, partial [Ranitomeya imitator]
MKSRKLITTKIYSRTWRKFLASSNFNIKEGLPINQILEFLQRGLELNVSTNSLCVPGFDPNLSMMTGITPINPMMAGMGLLPPPLTQLPIVKEIIHCKSCTLFPPNPNLPPPSTRGRPPGCKTVFVGGLPENSTDEIIQEVFEQCGDITAIRKSKKNFCHIRFSEEFMVDKAIYLSGTVHSITGSFLYVVF